MILDLHSYEISVMLSSKHYRWYGQFSSKHYRPMILNTKLGKCSCKHASNILFFNLFFLKFFLKFLLFLFFIYLFIIFYTVTGCHHTINMERTHEHCICSKCCHQLSDVSKNFFPVLLLWNLNYTKSNKKIISCIDKKKKKKNTQYIKSYNFILQVFLFWNCCMTVSLSILQARKHGCRFGFWPRWDAMTRQFL